MGLVREYLGSIAGVHIFAIISLMIFLVTFVVMIIHTYSLKKEEVREYGHFPLDDEDNGNKDY
jgi:hypothetical protein